MAKNSFELEMDEIYASDDPKLQQYLHKFMREEVDAAQERALIRLAWKFKHLLKRSSQIALERNYSKKSLAMYR